MMSRMKPMKRKTIKTKKLKARKGRNFLRSLVFFLVYILTTRQDYYLLTKALAVRKGWAIVLKYAYIECE